MYEIMVNRKFSAAHNLREYHGQCENLHGHNWKVEIIVRIKDLDQTGLALDFKFLKKSADEILKGLDHQYLNELPYFQDLNPTSENIAKFIFNRLANEFNDEKIKVARVSIWESEDSCASYFEE